MVDLDGGEGMSGINVDYPWCYLKHTLLFLLRHDAMRESRSDDDGGDVHNDAWTMWRLF